MIWIVTDAITEVIYRIAYLPVITITAGWCLWRTTIGNIKPGVKTAG
jgi:hypothetical protein